MSNRRKRPSDPAQLAKFVIDVATREMRIGNQRRPRTEPLPNSAAEALHRNEPTRKARTGREQLQQIFDNRVG